MKTKQRGLLFQLALFLLLICAPLRAERKTIEDLRSRTPSTPIASDLLWGKKAPYGSGDDFKLPLGDIPIEVLSDVDFSDGDPVEDDVLIFDGAVWHAEPLAAFTSGDFGDFTCVAGVCTLDAGTVSANELDEAGVEPSLESVLDLQDLQGAVTDAQVPDDITITVPDLYAFTAGDTFTGDVLLDDGSGDSPLVRLAPATGTIWSLFARDSTDDVVIQASSGSTETVQIENAGAGVADLEIDGQARATSFSAASTDYFGSCTGIPCIVDDGAQAAVFSHFGAAIQGDTTGVMATVTIQHTGSDDAGSGAQLSLAPKPLGTARIGADDGASRGSIEFLPDDSMVFATGSGPTTAMTIDASQVVTFAHPLADAQVDDAITVDGGTIDLPGSTVSDITDDQVLIGSGAGTAAFKTVPNCTTGKLLYTQSTNAWSCGTDATGNGGNGVAEYHPDNYPSAGDVLLEDEFTIGATLTWTAQNPDSQTIGYAMGGSALSAGGTTDAWHGDTTAAPPDSGQDWFFVTKVHLGQASSATQGCGISIITGGTAATPTEINSTYLKVASSTSAAVVHEDHDDYDFAGLTAIGASFTVAESASDINQLAGSGFYLALYWIDATEDIQALFSWDGLRWRILASDTTVDGYPVAIGKFSRDDVGCIFTWARVLDTDIDADGLAIIRVGG